MGRARRWAVAGALVVAVQVPFVATAPGVGVAATGAALPSNCAQTAAVVSCTFAYNGTNGSDGTAQPFVVPVHVTSIRVEAWGASGGDLPPLPPPLQLIGDPRGAPGGHVAATLTVSPGAQLSVRVGGHPTAGTGGFTGGGAGGQAGGGASDVRAGGDALANRVVVAGGGGGVGFVVPAPSEPFVAWPGGGGGGPSGGAGTCGASAMTSSPECGGGATPAGGGAAGQTTACVSIHGSFSSPAQSGSSGLGGTGGDSGCFIGSNVLLEAHGAGGGGGYFGGGGGGASASGVSPLLASGAGGGGSGHVGPTATGAVDEPGTRIGNGLVTITYVVARTPPNVRACLHGGWRTYVDGRGKPFPGVLHCVIWVLLHHGH